MNMTNQKAQPGQLITEKFRTGIEWQPGRPVAKPSRHKYDVTQPSDQIKEKVYELILDYFHNEQPKADKITIIPESVRLVDPVKNVWVASVQTVIVGFTTLGPLQHISRFRFQVLQVKNGPNIENHKFSLHHNHVIFI